MGTWAIGSLGYWDKKPDGTYEFEANLDSMIRMVDAIDESGNEATVTKEVDGEGFTVLNWKVKID